MARPLPPDSRIQHVVIIIQENRSFDNLFHGFPHADTRSYGYDNQGKKIKLQPVGLATAWDIRHNLASFLDACDGQGSYPGTDCQMNGFNEEYVFCGHASEPSCPNANPPYSYVPQSETAPYFSIAGQYVLADRMFGSNVDTSSFVAHQYLIAAQASSAANYPSDSAAWGCEGPPGDDVPTITQQRQLGSAISVCLNNQTLGDELDYAGLSWRFYATAVGSNGGEWSAYQAIDHIYNGPDWSTDVISPQTVFFSDVSNGNLPVVSWITPTYENSDHAGTDSDTGPSWVASLVNAVGESKYWDSTVIFILWDDYGGWYDHVPPKMLDYDGLGFRVPLLVVSAYSKQGYVSHVQYEFGSVLKFIEERFALAPLAASDARAESPAHDCCFWKEPPRTFKAIPSSHDKNYFLRQPLDLRPPDTE